MASSSSSSLPKDPPPPGPSAVAPPSLNPTTAAAPPSLNSTTAAPAPVKPEPATPSASTPAIPHRPPLPPPPSDADVVHIPTYSKWFSWNGVHDCEVRFLPEFFDSRSPSKNPRVYMYYRNSIVKHFRLNPSAKITFTEVRKRLVGDVGSIRRIFDFLDAWGLINYTPSPVNKPLKWEEKETKSSSLSGADGGGSSADSPHNRDIAKRLCSGCKSECTIACFVCDKYELTLCARCYVRGNYRVGVSSTDFRRVEISEEVRTEWTDKETLQLLEAVTHFGDDWRKVSLHVPGRSEKDCVTHFIKLPFGEQFAGYADLGELSEKHDLLKDCSDTDGGAERNGLSSASKKMRLTPLADASNPIMGQVAFLSALAGTEVAEAAAEAAVMKLAEVEHGASKGRLESLSRDTFEGASVAANGDTNEIGVERTSIDAKSLVEKEEADAETAISRIVEVKMQEIQDKIERFEKLDLVMEKERKQFEQMKNLLFVDQLVLLFHKKAIPITVEHKEGTN
ncbi:SWI/SNF complex subunit SWI3B [Euphorbia lathyris]|uniref:SWI/SNF complex subunit SWI3B n=1 Tax=Euphorbia lathyris TaxID=212925 RepID=UPI003314409B